MRVVGLFAGIGGFELGFEDAGLQTILTCENWPPAKAVLGARFQGVDHHDDVTDLADLPAGTDVISGGFPCQDLSQAGKTAGIDGARSGLVGEIFRLLDRSAPTWVVLENVPFMLQLDHGRAMTHLVEAFEQRRYRWAYRIVNTLGFGLPQRRERVFFVASRKADPADVLFADEAVPHVVRTRLDTHAHGFYWTEGTRGLGWAQDAVPTLKNGSTVGIPSPPAILLPDGRVVTPDIRDAERLQGFDADWTAPAEAVARRSKRWSLVGNAVTVHVAAWLGERLRVPGVHDADRDRPLAERWPLAARFDGKRRTAVAVSSFPVARERLPLAAFLNHPPTPLSARATEGFLRRAQASRLRFQEGFLDRIAAHLESVGGTRPDRPSASADSERSAELV